MKLNNPNHTTGVMSTPNAGGTDPLNNRRKGSVGQTIRLNGSSFILAVGYHDSTMRHNCERTNKKNCIMRQGRSRKRMSDTNYHHLLTIANEKKFKKGPSTKLSGCTQASVSERSTDEEATFASALTSIAPAPLCVTKSIASKGDAPKI